MTAACGDDSQGAAQADELATQAMSFVEACNQHCSAAHNDPADCPEDLSESLNACLQDCAQENALAFDSACEAAGVAYYACTWELRFVCGEGQQEPTPANLSDCSDLSGDWNACLLTG